jgi:hypothetical protein
VTIWPTVSATGHRPQHLDLGVHGWVRDELARLAGKLRTEHGLTLGISGMAIGTDLWWADALCRAGVPFEAHVPFPQQPKPWDGPDQAEWHRLVGLAARTVTYGADFDVKLLHARNDGMLRASSAVVAVHLPAKRTGGTASAVRKAAAMRLPIIHINPAARTTTLRNAARLAA